MHDLGETSRTSIKLFYVNVNLPVDQRHYLGKMLVMTKYLNSLTSEATPSATPYFKRAYKISHPPQLKVSWVDLPSLATSSKIWPNFSNKVF